MAKVNLAMLSVLLLLPQFVFASCDTSNIPGYYKDRYKDNGDGTITDKMTNLMWMKCDIDLPWDAANGVCRYDEEVSGFVVARDRISYTWQEALVTTNSLNGNGFANYRDWRLPNIKELGSILALHCVTPSNSNMALNTDVFDATSVVYWSSTPDRRGTETIEGEAASNQAWKISFRPGGELGARSDAIIEKHNVRLVRSIQ